MTIGERVAATLYVIILGMGITFTALVLIWGMTALLSRIVRSLEQKGQPAVAKAAAQAVKAGSTAPAPMAVSADAGTSVATDQSELIAVISAAIAASMHTSMHNIVVTSIRRTGDSTPVWGQMGRSDVMNSRL
jgi:sodium pump decarboxylase gamma subunit